MCLRQFIIMSTDTKLKEWIDLNVTDINFTLIIIDEINLLFIINGLRLVNFDNLFLF